MNWRRAFPCTYTHPMKEHGQATELDPVKPFLNLNIIMP